MLTALPVMAQRPHADKETRFSQETPYSPQQLEEFFTLALQGETHAILHFTALVLPRLVRLARRMLGDHAEAEDIAQETFLRAWRKGQSWDAGGTASIMTWMHKTALHLCYDRLRTREKPAETMPNNMDETPGALDLLVRDDAVKQVDLALQALPSRQRAALVLKHYEELSQKEAAKIMGIGPRALESLLARARRTLRARLMIYKAQDHTRRTDHDL